MSLPKNDFGAAEPFPSAWPNEIADLTTKLAQVDVSAGGAITLTAAEYTARTIELGGTLAANAEVILPADGGRVWRIKNNTTGSYTVTVKTASGNGVTIRQGYTALVREDGVDVVRDSPDVSDTDLYAPGLTVGANGGQLKGIIPGTVSINPPSLAANSTGTVAVTITGAAVGDFILMNLPSALESGLAFVGAYVSAADTVTLRLANVTGSAIDGAALTWGYLLWDLT